MDEFVYAFASYHSARPPIKIGRTTNLEQRLSQLRVGTPHVSDFVATFPCENATWMEYALHAHFKGRLVRGEWYDVSVEEFRDACADLSLTYAAIMQHEHLATAIAMQRHKLGMTQAQLADKAGLRQATISKAENCENLNFETIAKIAASLGMRVTLAL